MQKEARMKKAKEGKEERKKERKEGEKIAGVADAKKKSEHDLNSVE